MNFIIWIIFGGLAGWLATMIVGDDARFGIAGNIVVGIIGAFLGGWLADKMGMGGSPGAERPSSMVSFITSVIGAVILLLILNLLF